MLHLSQQSSPLIRSQTNIPISIRVPKMNSTQFNPNNSPIVKAQNQQLKEVRLKELEKYILQERLKRLKHGAELALQAKQHEIDQLREKLQEQPDDDSGEKKFQLSMRLQQETNRLKKAKLEISQEKQRYLSAITSKDRVICELYDELDHTKQEISQFEHSTHEMNEKLKTLEAETEDLHDQLLRSKTNLSILRESMKGLPIATSSKISELGSTSQLSSLFDKIQTEQSKHDIHIASQKIRSQMQLNRQQRQKHHRQLSQYQIYYDNLLMESQFQHKKSSLTSQSEYVSSDLKNQIRLLEEEPPLDLMSKRQASDSESQFSLNHFTYHTKYDRDDLSIHSVRQKDSYVSAKCSENLTEISEGCELGKEEEPKRQISLWKVAILGALLTTVLIKVSMAYLKK